MKTQGIIWAVTLLSVYLLAGKTVEQMIVAGQIGLFGFLAGVIGGKVASAFNAIPRSQSARRIR